MITKARPTLDEAKTDALVALAGLVRAVILFGSVVALLSVVPFVRWALGV